jgi:hypothetical protein
VVVAVETEVTLRKEGPDAIRTGSRVFGDDGAAPVGGGVVADEDLKRDGVALLEDAF